MNEDERNKQFEADLNRLIEQGQVSDVEEQSEDTHQMLIIAQRLYRLNASSECSFRLPLQERLRERARKKMCQKSLQGRYPHKYSGVLQAGVGVILLLALVLGLNWAISSRKPRSPGGVVAIPTETISESPTPSLIPTDAGGATPKAIATPTTLKFIIPDGAPDLPLGVGTTWVYLYEEYEPTGVDATQVFTATSYITETVIENKQAGSLFLAHIQRSKHFVNVPAGWPSPATDEFGTFWYVIDGAKVYDSPDPIDTTAILTNTLNLVYVLPLKVDLTWCPVQVDLGDPNHRKITDCTLAGKKTVQEITSYTTPLARFEDCFKITEDFTSGGFTQWFCNGVGAVAYQYDHGGSRFGFHQVLISYKSAEKK